MTPKYKEIEDSRMPNTMSDQQRDGTQDFGQSSADSKRLTLRTAELFKGDREVLIEHNGETYRLRITRGGKLILNK